MIRPGNAPGGRRDSLAQVDRSLAQCAQILLVVVTSAVGPPACVSHYTMPAANEPHAIVKLRISYHARAGTSLQQALMINGEAIDIPLGSGDLDTTTTHALRVREEPTQWAVSSMYYHVEMRTRLVTEYRTETYSCTSGFGASQRTSTCRRQVPYQVMRTVPTQVPDMTCGARAPQMPRNGHVYVLQYDFFGESQCALRCYEQVRDSVGGFSMAQCEYPPQPPR